MSKTISITSLGNPNSRARQINKELFEARLQLNLSKKTDNIPFSIKVNKSTEKSINLSCAPKNFSFQKYFKIPKNNLNSNKKRFTDLSNDNIKLNLNLSKFSNRKKEISNSVYTNPKTSNNSLINNRLNNSNFINTNYSTIRYNLNKNKFKKKEIRIQKKFIDINKTIKKDLSKDNKNNTSKRGDTLSLNLNISSFKNKFMKNMNKSGIIKATINKYNNNNFNNKNKSRNIFIESKLNSKENLKKKSFKNNNLNKNKRNDLTMKIRKENSINTFGKYSKKKFLLLLNKNNKYQYQSYNTYHPEDKIIFIQKHDTFKDNTKINNNKKNLNNNSNLQVNNVNINNYISCNISYVNNLNDKKTKNNIKNNNNNHNHNNNHNNNNELLLSKFEKKSKTGFYNNNTFNNTKIENSLNLLSKEKDIKKIKDETDVLIMGKDDYKFDSMFETEKDKKSLIDDESKEDSGLLSFDKIEDLIIYNSMDNINKSDDYLFFKGDREAFYKKYRKFLNKRFVLST